MNTKITHIYAKVESEFNSCAKELKNASANSENKLQKDIFGFCAEFIEQEKELILKIIKEERQ